MSAARLQTHPLDQVWTQDQDDVHGRRGRLQPRKQKLLESEHRTHVERIKRGCRMKRTLAWLHERCVNSSFHVPRTARVFSP